MSLRRGMLWSVIGNAGYALAQWAIIAAIAKQQTAIEVGYFSLAGAIVTPLLAFSQLNLRTVLATDANQQFAFSSYLRLRIFGALAMLAAIPVVTLAMGFTGPVFPVVIAFSCGKFVDSLMDIFYGYHQRRLDIAPISIAQLLNGTFSLLIFVTLLQLTSNLVIATWGYSAASLLVFLLWVLPRWRRARGALPDAGSNQVMPLFRLALPLGFVMLLSALAIATPQYFVGRLLTPFALGVFSAISYLMIVGANFMAAIGQVLAPKWAQLAVESKPKLLLKQLGISIASSLVLGLLGAVTALFIGPFLLTFLYSKDFVSATNLLAGLAVVAGISYAAIFAAIAATALRQFSSQLPVFIVVCLAGLLACSVLIPIWQLWGAIAAVGVIALTQLCGCLILVARGIRKLT